MSNKSNKFELFPDGNNINANSNNTLELAEEESKYMQHIIDVFCSYRIHSLRRLFQSIKYICSLPRHQQGLLKNYLNHLENIKLAIKHNYRIIEAIINKTPNDIEIKKNSLSVTQLEIEKLQSVFKQIYREWSAEAKNERDASFKPILDEIVQLFPPDKITPSEIRILVPGAGLGRLPYEIVKMGYSCEGNEFSLFMLFTSNFILNKCKGTNLFHIYPWVHQYHNNLKSHDQLLSVKCPDVNPHDIPPNSEFSMSAGNYIEVFQEKDKYDCIATCFFLDTAHNVVDYIETTWNILKPGGYWINLGPLLYHHADMPNEDSIEPSYEDIQEILVKIGFIIIEEKLNLLTPYCHNAHSMMCYEYKSVFFVCQKPDPSNSCTSTSVAKDC